MTNQTSQSQELLNVVRQFFSGESENAIVDDPYQVIRLIRLAMRDGLLLELKVFGYEEPLTAAFFNEKEVSEKHDSLWVFLTVVTKRAIQLIIAKKKVQIRLRLEEVLLESLCLFQELSVVDGKLCLQLGWPSEMRVSVKKTEKRFQVSSGRNIRITVRKRKVMLFRSRLFDVSRNGFSFINPYVNVKSKERPIQYQDESIGVVLHVPDKDAERGRIDIPLNGVIRRATQGHRVYDNAIVGICDVEIMLIAQNYGSLYAKMHRSVELDMQAFLERQGRNDR